MRQSEQRQHARVLKWTLPKRRRLLRAMEPQSSKQCTGTAQRKYREEARIWVSQIKERYTSLEMRPCPRELPVAISEQYPLNCGNPWETVPARLPRFRSPQAGG